MDYFRINVDLPRDPFVTALAVTIRTPLVATIGHLMLFWSRVAQHCPGGDLSGVSDKQIERWAEWKGSRRTFVAALRRFDFLIPSAAGGYLATAPCRYGEKAAWTGEILDANDAGNQRTT